LAACQQISTGQKQTGKTVSMLMDGAAKGRTHNPNSAKVDVLHGSNRTQAYPQKRSCTTWHVHINSRHLGKHTPTQVKTEKVLCGQK
jgi:hypothetical protein